MEIIDYIALIILTWGAIGAVCLMFIGIKKDIQNYLEIRRRLK
jgi:hypothetical protein